MNGNLQGTFTFGSNTCFIGIARHSFVFGPASGSSENFQTLSFYTESGILNHLLVGFLPSEFPDWTWNTHVGIPMLDIGIPM